MRRVGLDAAPNLADRLAAEARRLNDLACLAVNQPRSDLVKG